MQLLHPQILPWVLSSQHLPRAVICLIYFSTVYSCETRSHSKQDAGQWQLRLDPPAVPAGQAWIIRITVIIFYSTEVSIVPSVIGLSPVLQEKSTGSAGRISGEWCRRHSGTAGGIVFLDSARVNQV